MSFLVPDKIIAAEGEKTLRQYKCAKIASGAGVFKADAVVAVTNRRVILYAESGKGKGSAAFQSEAYVKNITGVTFYRGKTKKPANFSALFVLLALSAIIGGLIFWQAQRVYDFIKSTMPFDLTFKIVTAAAPLALTLLLFGISRLFSSVSSMEFTIHTGTENTLSLSGDKYFTPQLGALKIVPNKKETHRMFAEISSLILDIQKHGDTAVLKHIDAES